MGIIWAEFLAEERRMMTPMVYDQEYNCAFTVVEGQVYPDFDREQRTSDVGARVKWLPECTESTLKIKEVGASMVVVR